MTYIQENIFSILAIVFGPVVGFLTAIFAAGMFWGKSSQQRINEKEVLKNQLNESEFLHNKIVQISTDVAVVKNTVEILTSRVGRLETKIEKHNEV